MGFATTIAQLTQQSGRDAAEAKRDQARIAAAALTSNAEAQSHAAAAKGAIWGKTISDIGSSIADIPAQINRSKALDLQRQDIEAQVAERKAHAAKVQQEDAENQAVDRAFQESLRPDGTVDLQSFSSKIPGSKQQVYLPLIEKVNAAAETNRKNKESTAAHAFFSAYKGGTPASLVTAAKMGAAAGAMTPEDVQQIQQIAGAIASGPAEAQEGSTRTLAAHLGAHFPQFQDLLDADTGKQAGLMKTQAETEAARALTGQRSQPPTPTEASLAAAAHPGNPGGALSALKASPTAAETARHNQAMEDIGRLTAGRAQAAQNETARHNKVEEDIARNKTTNKPPTGAQSKALSYYNRAKEAVETLTDGGDNSLEQRMAKSSLASQLQLKSDINVLQTSEQQQYRQAQRAFTEARLRKESGAQVPNAEYVNDAKTYFAQPGDSSATIAQKAKARQTVLDGIKFESGPAYEGFYGEPNASPSKAGNASVRQEIPGHPGKFAVSKDGGKTWTAE